MELEGHLPSNRRKRTDFECQARRRLREDESESCRPEADIKIKGSRTPCRSASLWHSSLLPAVGRWPLSAATRLKEKCMGEASSKKRKTVGYGLGLWRPRPWGLESWALAHRLRWRGLKIWAWSPSKPSRTNCPGLRPDGFSLDGFAYSPALEAIRPTKNELPTLASSFAYLSLSKSHPSGS